MDNEPQEKSAPEDVGTTVEAFNVISGDRYELKLNQPSPRVCDIRKAIQQRCGHSWVRVALADSQHALKDYERISDLQGRLNVFFRVGKIHMIRNGVPFHKTHTYST